MRLELIKSASMSTAPGEPAILVMCYPDHRSYQHQLPEESVCFTERGNSGEDGCRAAKDRQQSIKRKG